MKVQEKKIKIIEEKQNESDLETKVKNLEKFVLHLPEKLEKGDS